MLCPVRPCSAFQLQQNLVDQLLFFQFNNDLKMKIEFDSISAVYLSANFLTRKVDTLGVIEYDIEALQLDHSV
jgi:hypothetical protein